MFRNLIVQLQLFREDCFLLEISFCTGLYYNYKVPGHLFHCLRNLIVRELGRVLLRVGNRSPVLNAAV